MSRTWKDTPERKYKDGMLRWPGPGTSRYVKRQLNHVRRKVVASFIAEELEEERPHWRGWLGWEREANWKTW